MNQPICPCDKCVIESRACPLYPEACKAWVEYERDTKTYGHWHTLEQTMEGKQ